MKTVVIGDVHGLDTWRAIVDRHKEEHIVFMGDYCDPYEEFSSEELIENLAEIIELKRQNMGRVTLLLGNHDMHYIYPEFPQGTRFDAFIAMRLRALIEDNRELFQFAYQEGKWLFTHAGISAGWWHGDFKGDADKSVADQLNGAQGEQLSAMFQCGMERGGNHRYGGIFWADKDELLLPLHGVHQVVGHTRVERVIASNLSEDTSVMFCDCLAHGCYGMVDTESGMMSKLYAE